MPFKILFINDNGINESLPSTDISAVLKNNGFETDLLIQKDEKGKFFQKIADICPDSFIVPFDIMGQQWSILVTKQLKARWKNVPIIAVGTYATLYPEVLTKSGADILCRGEAEYALLELFTKLRNNEDYSIVKNLWIKSNGKIIQNPMRPLIHDLDELPTPDRDLYYTRYNYIRTFSTKRIVAGRGCANRCFYCYNPGLQDVYETRGKLFTRKKSPEKVIFDIDNLVKNSVVKSLYFLDDLFTDDKDWLLKFCSLYSQEFKIPFACNVTASSIDEDKVKALQSAGCRAVLMGVETGNERLRVKVLNKIITNRQIITAVNLFKRYGIKFLTYNMLGLPGDTLETLLETVKFNQILRPDYLRATVAFPMPHTHMTELAISEGLVTQAQLDYIFSLPPKDQYSTSIYQSDAKFKKKLTRLFHLFRFAIKMRMPIGLVRILISVPFWAPILKWIQYFTILWEEKGIFDISLLSGIQFFLHTGHPLNKTKNANNFIP